MKGMLLRAVVALVLTGSAAFAAMRVREHRRALEPGSFDDGPLGEPAGEGSVGGA